MATALTEGGPARVSEGGEAFRRTSRAATTPICRGRAVVRSLARLRLPLVLVVPLLVKQLPRRPQVVRRLPDHLGGAVVQKPRVVRFPLPLLVAVAPRGLPLNVALPVKPLH